MLALVLSISLGAVAAPASSSSQAAPAGSTPAPQAAATAPAGQDKPAFKTEELEQMLAPIALYPDSLLTQLLMASTYPLEIVQADRWAKAHKGAKGDAAAKALEAEKWDASVKSLVNFPDVLSMLSDKLDWTQQIGDAFIGQQKDVMDTIQKLRTKAKDSGNLKTTKEQKVTVDTSATPQTIVIESASPDVVYVPATNTTVVYGPWPYPAYPPYPYYPPSYVYGGFGIGVAIGFAWGYAWGHSDWHHGNVDIDVNRNVNINGNIDRSKYQRDVGRGGSGTWKHDPSHRASVPYRSQATAQKFGGVSSAQAASAREAFRGRGGAEQLGGATRTDRPASAGAAGAGRADTTPAQRAGGGPGDRRANGATTAGERPRNATSTNVGTRTGAPPVSSGRARTETSGATLGGLSGSGALGGITTGGSATRASSTRGHASRGGGRGRR